jgi:hypothetical protein
MQPTPYSPHRLALSLINIHQRLTHPRPQDIRAHVPDAFIVNLETALTTAPTPWPRKGINYRGHPLNAAALPAGGVSVAVLANNHVADWGMAGLGDTLDALHALGGCRRGRARAGIDTGGVWGAENRLSAPLPGSV